jgi:hypothetical protein
MKTYEKLNIQWGVRNIQQEISNDKWECLMTRERKFDLQAGKR